MVRRIVLVMLAVMLLAACGGSSSMTSGAGAEEPAAAGPEATVEQAIAAMVANDEAGLTELFDQSLGDLRSVRAFESIRTWIKYKSDAQVPSALGPVKSREMLAPEIRGQTTVMRVRATHEKETSGKNETSLWEFSLTQTEQGWRLLNIHGQWEE
jgi:hypothetical protein